MGEPAHLPGATLTQWAWRILFIALLNTLSGWLSLKLAIPPGYVTPVFPPAGIALGAMLLWGVGIWPGVLLGSLGVNTLVALLSLDGLSGDSFGLAAVIATGSTVQAILGCILIERLLPGARTLREAQRVVPMLLLGGPLICLVASCIGSLTLVAAGKSSWAAWPFSFWSWWVGDSIGVILCTPMFLVLAKYTEPDWRRHVLVVVVPSVSMLGLVVALFFQTNVWENERIDTAFRNHARTVVETLRRDTTRYEDAVSSVRQFFEATVYVSPAEFEQFTRELLQQYPGMLAIEYAPQVSAVQRPTFEQAVQSFGFPGFRIMEQSASGEFVNAAARPDYFPLLYISPAGSLEQLRGFDLGSSVPRRDAVLRARDGRGPVSTVRLPLLRDLGSGVLVMESVYHRQGLRTLESSAAAPDRFRGIVMGVFTLEAMIQQSIPEGLENDMVVTVDDVTDARHADPLYGGNITKAYPGRPWRVLMPFADRQWALRLYPSEAFVSRQRSYISWLVLAGGLLFTGILQMLLLALTGYTRNIEAEVQLRTRELADSEARFRAVFHDSPDAIVVVDLQGRIVSTNPRAAHLFGYQEAALLRQPVEVLLPGRLRQLHQGHRMTFADDPQLRPMGAGLELRAQRADGSEFPCDVMLSPMHLAEQTLIIAIIDDITERTRLEQARKESQQRLNHALQEKDMLLKEVYHRVKNNLQVIQSLLNLEGRSLQEVGAQTALDNTAARVRAMALVHEKLYQSGNLASISLADYLKDLLLQLHDAGALDTRGIHIDTEVDDVQLGLDAAIPLGMLLNELVSNSIKHGFAGRPGGRVLVSVRRTAEGLRLLVSDDGVGLPAGFDLERGTGLGLKLASSLARQLGGALGAESAAGTVFRVDISRF